MPRCQNCGGSVSSSSLKKVGDAIVCSECGRPKIVEGKMAENRKRVASVILNEVPTKDGATDHEISVEVRLRDSYGGLDVNFNTTFDRVRDFFTQKREKGKRASLKAPD